MIRYLETFYRHRLLVLTPVLLAVAIALSIVLVQPKTYDSTARIWFYRTDLATIAQPSTTVADQQAAVFRELLNARSFDLKAGERGPLSSYLAAAGGASNLPSRVGARLGLAGVWSTAASGSESVDDHVYKILSKTVLVAAPGAQVVEVSFAAPNAEVAQGTVQALLDEFTAEVLDNRRAQAQAVIDFYDQQLTAQAAAVATAEANVSKYLAAHPKSRSDGPAPDVTLITLTHAAEQARAQYAQYVVGQNQAKLDLAAQNQAEGAGFRVLDAPNLPNTPDGILPGLIRAAVAGLLVGLLVAAFSLLTLTAADTSIRHPNEVRRALGLRMVGQVPRLQPPT
jgi:uncharacterized protein involved in exopolysaccharide biosynthesis